MSRLLCCVLSFFIVFPALGRELPTTDIAEAKDRIGKLIQSTSIKDRTWAAYLAGEFELKEYAPALIELVVDPMPYGEKKAYGPYPVYYQRDVFHPGARNQRWVSTKFGDYDNDRVILGYLALMLNTIRSELSLRDRYTRSIAWSGTTRYLNDVVRIREDAIRDFYELKKQLVEKGLLAQAESASLRFNLSILVRDLRTDKTANLPDIYSVKFHSAKPLP
jgi:hypothetical protein